MSNLPYGYCQCGCGEKTTIAPKSDKYKGWVKGQPQRFLPNHHTRVPDSPPPNPSGLCQCGCGQKTHAAPQSCIKHGVRYMRGQSYRFISGHQSRVDTESAFWEKVNKSGALYTDPTTGETSHCWEWTAGTIPGGYGMFSDKGKHGSAHRYSYKLAHGSIPDGLNVLHKCDNRPCVNPSHLYAGTSKDNRRDAKERNRMNLARGEQRSKQFTEADVLAMRADWRTGAFTLSQLGDRYHAHRTTVSAIVHYHNWKHVK